MPIFYLVLALFIILPTLEAQTTKQWDVSPDKTYIFDTNLKAARMHYALYDPSYGEMRFFGEAMAAQKSTAYPLIASYPLKRAIGLGGTDRMKAFRLQMNSNYKNIAIRNVFPLGKGYYAFGGELIGLKIPDSWWFADEEMIGLHDNGGYHSISGYFELEERSSYVVAAHYNGSLMMQVMTSTGSLKDSEGNTTSNISLSIPDQSLFHICPDRVAKTGFHFALNNHQSPKGYQLSLFRFKWDKTDLKQKSKLNKYNFSGPSAHKANMDTLLLSEAMTHLASQEDGRMRLNEKGNLTWTLHTVNDKKQYCSYFMEVDLITGGDEHSIKRVLPPQPVNTDCPPRLADLNENKMAGTYLKSGNTTLSSKGQKWVVGSWVAELNKGALLSHQELTFDYKLLKNEVCAHCNAFRLVDVGFIKRWNNGGYVVLLLESQYEQKKEVTYYLTELVW